MKVRIRLGVSITSQAHSLTKSDFAAFSALLYIRKEL